MERTFNVLFLCTGNSARSILAEAYLNIAGAGRFKAFSAGSHPTGRVNPLAIELLERNRIATDNLRSKAWDEFARADAPEMDIVITVCDQAAGELCPVWPGRPVTAHWGIQDPAATGGDEQRKRRAFVKAFTELKTRIDLLTRLSTDKLHRLAVRTKLEEMSRAGTAT